MRDADAGTRILIDKSARRLHLWAAGAERVHTIALGSNAAADKEIEGDCATPLGEFYVCAKNPRSKFFRSLCLSYPNAEDAARGLAAGLIDHGEHDAIVAAITAGKMPPQHTRLGGEIYIHGSAEGADTIARDWTRGCIALDNTAMRDIYDLAVIGTPVSIIDQQRGPQRGPHRGPSSRLVTVHAPSSSPRRFSRPPQPTGAPSTDRCRL